MPVVTAPFDKFPDSLGKGGACFQIFVIDTDNFPDTVVNPVVYLRLDQSVEGVNRFFSFIQFYSAYLYDFKGKAAVGIFFSLRALVPFQVKNNKIHDFLDSPNS